MLNHFFGDSFQTDFEPEHYDPLNTTNDLPTPLDPNIIPHDPDNDNEVANIQLPTESSNLSDSSSMQSDLINQSDLMKNGVTFRFACLPLVE